MDVAFVVTVTALLAVLTGGAVELTRRHFAAVRLEREFHAFVSPVERAAPR
jgi:hypothetical protein